MLGDRELGYLWVSDDDAAGYVWRPDGFDTGQVRVKRLRTAKAAGLSPRPESIS